VELVKIKTKKVLSKLTGLFNYLTAILKRVNVFAFKFYQYAEIQLYV